MYGASCHNKGTLNVRFWQLLIKKYMEVGLAQKVNLASNDSYYTAIKRVIDTFKFFHPQIRRKVKFINLEEKLDERAADNSTRLYYLAELAELG